MGQQCLKPGTGKKKLERILVLAFALISMLALSTPALATNADVYGGATFDTQGQYYVFMAGAVEKALHGARFFIARAVLSSLGYKYRTGGSLVKASSPGLRLTGGMEWKNADRYFVLAGGLDYRNTSLKPDDPGAKVRGSQAGAAIETAFGSRLSELWRADLLGSFTTIGNGLWGKGSLKRLVYSGSKQVYAGVDIIAQGNHDYSEYGFGPAIELHSGKSSFQAAAGYSRNNGIPDSVYFQLGFFKAF